MQEGPDTSTGDLIVIVVVGFFCLRQIGLMCFRVCFVMSVQAKKVIDHDDSDDGFDRVAAADLKAKSVLDRAHNHLGEQQNVCDSMSCNVCKFECQCKRNVKSCNLFVMS